MARLNDWLAGAQKDMARSYAVAGQHHCTKEGPCRREDTRLRNSWKGHNLGMIDRKKPVRRAVGWWAGFIAAIRATARAGVPVRAL